MPAPAGSTTPTRTGTSAAATFDRRAAAGRRPPAAVLHLRDHGAAETGRAQPRVVPDRAPVDDVLDRPATGRRAPEHLLAGLGEARLDNVFAPWIAGATVFIYNYARFHAGRRCGSMAEHGVSTFCAPPTVWRMLIQADLSALAGPAARGGGRRRAAEPGSHRTGAAGLGDHHPRRLRPDRDDRCRSATAPGSRSRRVDGTAAAGLPGGAGRPDDRRSPGRPEGEICLDLAQPARPDARLPRTTRNARAEAMRDWSTTPVTWPVDEDGLPSPTSGAPTTCSRPRDYRISPFELECVLMEHEAVAEAAVVPAPDPLRLAVPKAYVVLAAGCAPGRETAAVDLRGTARDAPGPVQADPAAGVRRPAEDHLRQDPPGRAARAREERRDGRDRRASSGRTTSRS